LALTGRPIWEVVRHPRIEELIGQALRGTNPERLEFRVARTQSVISVAASRLPGRPCPGAVLVLHDVTELRRLEQLRREFVANVSHELKTPLTSISAYTETLLDGAVDDAEHNRVFLQRIEEQTDRLQGLIIDLLALARLDAEDTAYELLPIEIAPVLTASVEAHLAVAEAKRIELQIHGTADEVQVFADPEGIRTIVDNLLDNALNYTPAGGRIDVRWIADGEWLQIEVSDTGIGIAKEHQARIFERFFRIDKARSRELGGTGLGLAIVKHLCQVFGGSVSVASQLGQGSTFTVRLQQPATSVIEQAS
jgi:two-component system, OmpR family, phosphate regulon sensor histidine kinase PhoR